LGHFEGFAEQLIHIKAGAETFVIPLWLRLGVHLFPILLVPKGAGTAFGFCGQICVVVVKVGLVGQLENNPFQYK
jgi:hypothetical protein